MPKLDLEMWLRAEEVEPKATLVFVDEGEHGLIPKEGKDEDVETFEIGVMLPNKEKRKWTMNMTSQRAVAQSYTTDSKKWVGKKVEVYVSVQNVRGTEKKVIYAKTPPKP